MHFRVTSTSYAQRAIHFSSLHSSNLLRYQEQITSGVRYQRPSEEPIAFRQVTSLQSRFTELEADRSSIDRATSILNASFAQIQDFSDLITRAKSLTQTGIQSFDAEEREALALEVDGLLGQLQSIGLAQFNDRYLYSGTDSEVPPFEFVRSDLAGGKLDVIYHGAKQRSRASVADSISVDTYYTGLEVFAGPGRESTVLVGSTGAATGPGTDTIIGRAALQVTHELTTYAGASGVAAGASSPGGDGVIGALGRHSVTIVDTAGDGSAGTIRLNSGPEVAFTSADTDLRVEAAPGQFVYVDMSSIAAGFNGTVDLTATGRMSVDGGLTDVAIDHTGNQVVVDSLSGDAVTIDSTEISQAGTDHLEFLGTSDAFQVLYDLSSDLRNSRGLTDNEVSTALDRRLGELEGIASTAFAFLGEQATSLSTLDSLGFRIDDLKLDVETQINEVQATDLPDAVLRLENSQTLLQYTYAVTAQISRLSLLNFLN